MSSKGSLEGRMNKIKNFLGSQCDKNRNIALIGHYDFTKNRKMDYVLYSLLSIKANFNQETKERYVYYKDIDFKLLGEILGVTSRTAQRRISKMVDMGILVPGNSELNGMYYSITTNVDDRFYSIIEMSHLIEMLSYNDDDLIRVYLVLKSLCSKEPRELTRDFIGARLGLKPNTHTQKLITDKTDKLKTMKMIKKERFYMTKWKEETRKIVPHIILKYSVI